MNTTTDSTQVSPGGKPGDLNFSNSIMLISDEEMWALYGNYAWWYARHMQNKFHLDGEDVEDIVSEAKINLIKCPQHVRHYKPYVTTVVNNSTRKWLLKNIKPKREHEMSLDALTDQASFGGDTVGEQHSVDTSSNDDNSYLDGILRDPRKCFGQELMEGDFMEKFWQETEGVEQLLIILVLGLDGHKPRTFLTAGKLVGLSKEKAKIIYENAIDRVRENLK